MKILVLAPFPYFRERGTPIALSLLLRGMSSNHHEVDLLTLPFGEDKPCNGLRIFRCELPWNPKEIRPGFSVQKIFFDFAIFFKALHLTKKIRYDYVHAIEESSFFALLLKHLRKIPYVYDMDSLLSQQFTEKFPFLKFMNVFFEGMESIAIRSATQIVAVCEALANHAKRLGGKKISLLTDVSMLDELCFHPAQRNLRQEYGVQGKILMYIGNLESYQGIDLLLESLIPLKTDIAYRLLVLGGNPKTIAAYQSKIATLGISDKVVFTGPVPLTQLKGYLQQADILLSPRIHGENTPMKIYSYLDSGRPVIATNLLTHTQVMNRDVSLLVEPTPAGLAEGIKTLLEDAALCQRLALNAKHLVEKNYSLKAFDVKLTTILASLDNKS